MSKKLSRTARIRACMVDEGMSRREAVEWVDAGLDAGDAEALAATDRETDAGKIARANLDAAHRANMELIEAAKTLGGVGVSAAQVDAAVARAESHRAWLKAQGLPLLMTAEQLLASPDSLTAAQRKYLAAYVGKAVSK